MARIIGLTVTIPDSILPYPEGLWNQAKYLFWQGLSPAFTALQRFLLAIKVLHHEGRQHYILGKLVAHKTADDFLKYIESIGFGNHFIAWKDDGQIIGLRKLDGFEHQYHLRLFQDGEVRGHYEFTPEAHPFKHLHEVGIEERREMFLNFLAGWIELLPA